MNKKFSKISFSNFPSFELFPDNNLSLKMINTINVIPNPSFSCLDIPIQQSNAHNEESIADYISHVPTATNSAKKKRFGCICKKTFCLKMYCQCFSNGKVCGQDCGCNSCKNTIEFKQEIAEAKNNIKDGGLKNCSLAEKRCNCKKSHCLKRYCECFNSGKGCSQACKCQGCKNIEIALPPSYNAVSEQPQKKQSHIQKLKIFPSINKYNSIEELERYYD